MKLDMPVEVIRQNISRRLFITMEEYESLDYGQILQIFRYSPVIDGLVELDIRLQEFYYDEEGNGWVCGYINQEPGDSHYIEKLVAPNIK